MNTTATGVLQPITPAQVKAYSKTATDEQAQYVSAEYNQTWAGKHWHLRNGEITYTKT